MITVLRCVLAMVAGAQTSQVSLDAEFNSPLAAAALSTKTVRYRAIKRLSVRRASNLFVRRSFENSFPDGRYAARTRFVCLETELIFECIDEACGLIHSLKSAATT